MCNDILYIAIWTSDFWQIVISRLDCISTIDSRPNGAQMGPLGVKLSGTAKDIINLTPSFQLELISIIIIYTSSSEERNIKESETPDPP